jgi:hypothetical protein
MGKTGFHTSWIERPIACFVPLLSNTCAMINPILGQSFHIRPRRKAFECQISEKNYFSFFFGRSWLL